MLTSLVIPPHTDHNVLWHAAHILDLTTRYKYDPPRLDQLKKMDGICKPPSLGGVIKKGLNIY